jgi:hypothetical protein
MAIAVRDSATTLDGLSGRVAIVASHAGTYAALLCAAAGLSGVLLHDAGIGRDGAGIAGLDDLDRLGIPAAALTGAAIGDGADCAARGVVSRLNAAASACGVVAGMPAARAAALLPARPARHHPAPAAAEARHVLAPGVLALDSAGLIGPADAGLVVATGSHGNLLGGRPATAAKAAVFAALFNDAGDPAPTRLPALDARGIAAATVAALSARIGDGRSTAGDGVLSHVNRAAARLGLHPGMAAPQALARLAAAREKGA